MKKESNTHTCHDQGGSNPIIWLSTGAGACRDHGLLGPLMCRSYHRGNEPIASAGNSLQKTWVVSRVVQSRAQFPHCRIQRVVKLHKRVARPQFLADFLPGYELIRTLQQQRQNLERLLLQTNPNPGLGKLALMEIRFEGSETNNMMGCFAPLH